MMNIIDLHGTLWRQLLDRRSRLPHALLVCGPRGVGKLALMQSFAAALLCEQVVQGDAGTRACGQCPACNWFAQGNHPDFRMLQPEALDPAFTDESGSKKPSQQITIDQVRALDDFLHVGTHRAGIRIVLLSPAEAMNRATANALLKTLEEPSPNTLFLLVTSEPDRLLPTIRSRCQRVLVPLPGADDAQRWLRANEVAEAARWLPLAGGAPLLAAELAQPSMQRLLDGLIAELQQGAMMDPVASAAALDRLLKADKGERGSPRMKDLILWAQKWTFDLSLAAVQQPARHFPQSQPRLAQLASATSACRLSTFARQALQYRAQAEHPLNSRMFLESFCLEYASLFAEKGPPQ